MQCSQTRSDPFGSNRSRWLHARRNVSCVRSSANSGRPLKPEQVMVDPRVGTRERNGSLRRRPRGAIVLRGARPQSASPQAPSGLGLAIPLASSFALHGHDLRRLSRIPISRPGSGRFCWVRSLRSRRRRRLWSAAVPCPLFHRTARTPAIAHKRMRRPRKSGMGLPHSKAFGAVPEQWECPSTAGRFRLLAGRNSRWRRSNVAAGADCQEPKRPFQHLTLDP